MQNAGSEQSSNTNVAIVLLFASFSFYLTLDNKFDCASLCMEVEHTCDVLQLQQRTTENKCNSCVTIFSSGAVYINFMFCNISPQWHAPSNHAAQVPIPGTVMNFNFYHGTEFIYMFFSGFQPL